MTETECNPSGRGAAWTAAENVALLTLLLKHECLDNKSAKLWDVVVVEFGSIRTRVILQDHLTEMIRFVSSAVMKSTDKQIIDPARTLFLSETDREVAEDQYRQSLLELMTTKTISSSKDFGSPRWWNDDVISRVLEVIHKRAIKSDTVTNIEKAESERKNKFEQEKDAKTKQVGQMREEEVATKKARLDRDTFYQKNDAKKTETLEEIAASQKASNDAFIAYTQRRGQAVGGGAEITAENPTTTARLDKIESTLADIFNYLKDKK